MTKTSTTPTDIDPLDAIVAALRDGGPRTGGQLADYMGIPYSTLTPRLRQLEDTGRAERRRDATRANVWHPIDRDDTAATDANGGAPDIAGTTDDEPATTGQPDDADHEATATTGPAEAPADTDTAQPDADLVDAPPETLDAGAAETEAQTAAEDVTTDGDIEQPQVTATTADNTQPPGTDNPPAKTRRAKGAIPAAILDLTRANPDTAYKVSQLSKAIGASPGAIANAADKLVTSGELLLVAEKPATYKAA